MTKPATLVLVPPPAGSAAAWNRVIPILDELGVQSVAVELPSGLPESEETDVEHLRSVLDDHGGDVVLAAHSSGCVPMTEVGCHPTVRHLIYVDGPLWEVDEPWDLVFKGGTAEGFGRCWRFGSEATELDPDKLSAYLQSRGWSAEDTQDFVTGLVPHRYAAGTYKITVAAWQTIPSTFIRPLDSESKPHVQDVFAARASEVIEIEGDHFPHWLRPREVAETFARIARDAAT
ncbi:MAG: alpha/beta hydrolase [bacterium]